MAEFRLHIRPRLGSAMTLASDGIVPMAARAVSRRADPVGAGDVNSTEHADLAGTPPITADAEAATVPLGASVDEGRGTGVRHARTEPRQEHSRVRPALQLVSADGPSEPGNKDTRATEPQSPGQSATVQREVLASAVAKVLSRREASGSDAQPFRLEMLSELMGPRRIGPSPGSPSLPMSSAEMQPAAPAERRTGGIHQTSGEPARFSEPMSELAQPRAGTARSTGPANARRQPGAASHNPVPSRAATRTDFAETRPTDDQKDRIAKLLMPALPDIVPEAANQGPEPESDFEFEMRVRAAMEKILSQDLLRHGLIAPEVL